MSCGERYSSQRERLVDDFAEKFTRFSPPPGRFRLRYSPEYRSTGGIPPLEKRPALVGRETGVRRSVSIPVEKTRTQPNRQAQQAYIPRPKKLRLLKDFVEQLRTRGEVTKVMLARRAVEKDGPLYKKTTQTSLTNFLYTLEPEERGLLGF